MKDRLISLQAKAEQARETHAHRAEGATIRFTADLVAAMKSSDFTRSALADTIGTSPACVTKILKGETNFTLDSMVNIANALNCELTIGFRPLPPTVSIPPTPRSKASDRQIAPFPSLMLNDQPRG